MDANKMREQFESAYAAYCERLGWKTYTAFHMLSEVYVKGSTELAWQMWQASREILVVELPIRPHASEGELERMTEYEIGLGHGGCEEWDKIRDKIKAQGLKVKL